MSFEKPRPSEAMLGSDPKGMLEFEVRNQRLEGAKETIRRGQEDKGKLAKLLEMLK